MKTLQRTKQVEKMSRLNLSSFFWPKQDLLVNFIAGYFDLLRNGCRSRLRGHTLMDSMPARYLYISLVNVASAFCQKLLSLAPIVVTNRSTSRQEFRQDRFAPGFRDWRESIRKAFEKTKSTMGYEQKEKLYAAKCPRIYKKIFKLIWKVYAIDSTPIRAQLNRSTLFALFSSWYCRFVNIRETWKLCE